MISAYPTLIGEIAKRGIKKSVIAKHVGISERALYNKLGGLVSFTWEEVLAINTRFFPDYDPASLFARAEQDSKLDNHISIL